MPRRVVRLWFSPRGAEMGKPWLVMFDDGEIARRAEVTVTGTFEGKYATEGERSLQPDSPRAYLERKLDEAWRDDAVTEHTE